MGEEVIRLLPLVGMGVDGRNVVNQAGSFKDAGAVEVYVVVCHLAKA